MCIRDSNRVLPVLPAELKMKTGAWDAFMPGELPDSAGGSNLEFIRAFHRSGTAACMPVECWYRAMPSEPTGE